MAIKKAKEVDAELIMATDPDSDRVGLAVKNKQGEYTLLNGNQTGALLVNYVISRLNERNQLHENQFVVKTIVTTELIADIAENYNVECYHVLTGFKFIADIIKQLEGRKKFIAGGEESYGYLVGDFVRDKDAVIACALFAEIAAFAKHNNKSLYDLLLEIYLDYGLYNEALISVVKKGMKGSEQIKQIMDEYRNTPPATINNSEVMIIHDFWKQKSFDTLSQLRYDINLPQSNVLQFLLKDGSKISLRPSGTEPKIKLYISVKEPLVSKDDYESVYQKVQDKIQSIRKELNLE
jgi:phosphoglucomutase